MQTLIKRINEIANEAKKRDLTEEEIQERDYLRQKYIQKFRENFKNDILNNIYILEEDGTKTKLTDQSINKN